MTNARTETRHIVTIVLGGRTGAHRDQIVTKLVERYLPTALVGERMTPRTGFGRAASHALFAGSAIMPPPRPADVETLVAEAAAAVAVAEAEIGAGETGEGPIEAFATLSAPAPDETLNQGSVAPEAEIGTLSEAKVVPEPEKEPETKQVAALVVPPTKPASEPKKQSDAANGSSTPYVIQIAAAVNERAAHELLERARERIGKPLEKAEPFVERVALKRSTVYRARFGGFEAAGDARSACRLLEQAGFDCFQARTAPLSG